MNALATQMNTAKHKTRSQIGCLVTLICFSAFLAFTAYPYGTWRFGAAFGLLSLVSMFLRVGWLVPLTVAGAYFGMIVLDPPVKGGTIESEVNETVGCILLGAVVGFAVGASIDASRHAHRRQIAMDGTTTADEQSVGHGAADNAGSDG